MRVLISMRYTPDLSAAVRAMNVAPSTLPSELPGFSLDQSYTPLQIPERQLRDTVGEREVGRLFSFSTQPEVSTYLIRGEVEDEAARDRLVEAAQEDPNIVGVFSDPLIQPILICPGSPPVGDHQMVENRLHVSQLRSLGMDGTNVLVAIVDTGVNLAYLQSKGKAPGFDLSKSWAPIANANLGNMPVDHGTMCAFDACIAAPKCTLLDYALLTSRAGGSTVMEGFLSDAVRGYSNLLQLMLVADEEKPALIVNNSWGMFHPSWDFPVGHPGNYSDNPEHPFNIIVDSLEDAGADILFAAGNCGQECPDGRCEQVTNRAIYGANSHSKVLCIAGIDLNKGRVGYSSKGPGRLQSEKPDLCVYTHFSGSGVYPEDGGTSAACPVAAGVVAAIRSIYSPLDLPPAQLRQLLRRTAEDLGMAGFDYTNGYGLIDVPELLKVLEKGSARQIQIGETVSGSLPGNGTSTIFQIVKQGALSIELDGPSGQDFDLYVRKGEPPTIEEYDYRGYTSLADEKIRIYPLEPSADYYVMVHSYRGSGNFTLKTILH